MDKGLHPKEVIITLSESLLAAYDGKPLTDKYAMYQHIMDYWAETMQDDMYEIAADGWAAGNEVKRQQKATKKGDKTTFKDVPGLEGLEGRLIPPALLVEEYFSAEEQEITTLNAELEDILAQQETLLEEHGGEGFALHDISSDKDIFNAINEYYLLAWEEYLPEQFRPYAQKRTQLVQLQARISQMLANELFAAFKSAKGKIVKKSLETYLRQTEDKQEKKLLEEYLDLVRQENILELDMERYSTNITHELNAKRRENPDGEYFAEIDILDRYYQFLQREKMCKSRLAILRQQLERKVIAQYSKLSTDDIKRIVIEQKWLRAVRGRIQTEMESVSRRLAGRIKELAERYAVPLPAQMDEVRALEEKVNAHLAAMGFVWQ